MYMGMFGGCGLCPGAHIENLEAISESLPAAKHLDTVESRMLQLPQHVLDVAT